MLDLWFSEFHAPDAKLSILVKEQLYSEQTPFQKIDFFDFINMKSFCNPMLFLILSLRAPRKISYVFKCIS